MNRRSWKLGYARLEKPWWRRENQLLKKCTGVCQFRFLCRPPTLAGPDNQKSSRPVLTAEKEVQPLAKDQGNSCESGQRGDQLTVFQLRQHGRRKAGLLAQINQRDLPLQPKAAEFFPQPVPGNGLVNRFTMRAFRRSAHSSNSFANLGPMPQRYREKQQMLAGSNNNHFSDGRRSAKLPPHNLNGRLQLNSASIKELKYPLSHDGHLTWVDTRCASA